MAKIVKSNRDIVDVNEEIEKVTGKNKTSGKDSNKSTKVKKSTKKVNDTKQKKGLGKFFKEVKTEMSKVKWPSKKDMVKYTIATVEFIVFFAIFFYIIMIIMAFIKEII